MGFGKAAESIIKPTAESRKVLRAALEKTDLHFVLGDGYYAFIELGRYVQAGGWQSTEGLNSYLGEEYGIAVVPGVYFSDAGKDWVRFSYALPPEKTQKAIDRMLEGLANLMK